MKKTILEHNQSRLIPTRLIIGYTMLAIISGLCSFAFIATINKLISLSLSSGPIKNPQQYLFTFLGIIVAFFITRRLLSGGIINLSQNIYWNIRRDVIKLILRAPYRKLQEYKGEVYSTLTADVGNITNASFMVITFFSSIILIVSCLVYMAYLSLILFAISLGVIALGVVVYLFRSRKSNEQFKEVRELERNFINIFNTLLHGAKEININQQKGNDIYEGNLTKVIEQGEETNTKAFLKYLNSELISQLLFYFLITFILIYAGDLLNVSLGTVVSFVFVLLYLMGPIVSVMTIMPAMNRATVSLKKMSELKAALQKLGNNHHVQDIRDSKYSNFSKLEINDFTFAFGTDKFGVGPINLSVNRNEVVFIHGGNGAGKTTFINTILKLYDLDKGEVYIDGQLIPAESIDGIKAMFAPVFSDFYLFDGFYGIKNVDLKKAAYLLKVFELEDKVSIENDRFSTIDLSTGQRKRLALISALLENRPILVLDEWAADQDPHFRRKFYTEIIPMMAEQEDKTIIAITHDDRYYDLADKLLKMEYGQLVEVNKSTLEAIG